MDMNEFTVANKKFWVRYFYVGRDAWHACYFRDVTGHRDADFFAARCNSAIYTHKYPRYDREAAYGLAKYEADRLVRLAEEPERYSFSISGEWYSE